MIIGYWVITSTEYLITFPLSETVIASFRRRGKNTTRRREGVGVVVEKKMKKVDELSTKIRVIYLQQ